MVPDRTNLGEFPLQSSEISSTSDFKYKISRPSPILCCYLLRNNLILSRRPTSSIQNSIPHNERRFFINNNQRLEDLQRNAASRRNGIFIVVTIFITCLVGLLYVYRNFPKLDPNERNHIKLPTNIEDAQLLGKVLANYTDKYYFEVLIAIILTFLFLQSFAIPGTLFLSILCGFLFSFPIALLVICFCSATGASFCYLVSNRFLRSLITHYFPDQVKKYTDLVRKHKDNLFNYMLFLRMTPILPNWFINITSPVVQVPIYTFWIGTFIGVAPPSIVAIQAGQTLLELTSSSGTWSWTSVIVLGALAVASLIPVFLKDKLKKKFA